MLGEPVFAFSHITSFDVQYEQLPARRDDNDVAFAKALLIALHARPGQVVKDIKRVRQAVLQHAKDVPLARCAQMGSSAVCMHRMTGSGRELLSF
jgi:hypothetical protein